MALSTSTARCATILPLRASATRQPCPTRRSKTAPPSASNSRSSRRPRLFHADLPLTLWPDTVETASFLRNRSPAAGKQSTPWELAFNRKPDLSTLRVFGSRAHVFTASPRNKLAPHATSGILIGYAHKGNAYKLLMDDNKTVIARAAECVINESRFGVAAPSTGRPTNSLLNAPTAKRSTAAADSDDATDSDDDGNLPPPPPPPSSGSDDDDDETPAAMVPRRNPPRAARGRQLGYEVAPATALITTAANDKPPSTYAEACAAPDATDWADAMQDEIDALNADNVYDVVNLPPGEKTLPLKWVYALK